MYHRPVERTQISLTASQAAHLRRLARARRTSMAALIRDAVDRAYGLPGSTRPDPWVRAVDGIGGFHSAHSNTSVEHDRELADAYDR